MKTRPANIEDLEKILNFNKEVFPNRPNSDEFLDYRLLKNPYSNRTLDSLYITENDEGEIIAQSITLPEKIAFKNQIYPAYWGQDYIVKEEYRKYGIGIGLSKLFLKKDFYFGVHASPKALQLQLKLGCKVIGRLDYLYKPTSYFHLLKFLFRRLLKLKNPSLKKYVFPSSINNFNLIERIEDFNAPYVQWNQDIIETLRDSDFIQWRFLFKKNRYFIYQMKNSETGNPAYFVVRPVQWKAVNSLMLVDYRYNIQKASDFVSILKTVHFLAKKLNLYAVFTSSSLTLTHEILLSNHYKKLKGSSIFCTFPFQHKAESETTNNYFQASLADSDSEFYFGKGKFIYGEDY